MTTFAPTSPRATPTRPSAWRSSASCAARSQGDELLLHFQPKIAIGSGELAGVEALIRWNHPERGLIPPVEFVPLAERTGMIGAVTDWVLASALGQCARWREAGLELPVAVNLVRRRRRSTRAWPSGSTARSQTAGLPGRMLQCEISEDTVLADPQRAIASLAACARWACSSRWTTSARASPR